jgi:hypothetical protein
VRVTPLKDGAAGDDAGRVVTDSDDISGELHMDVLTGTTAGTGVRTAAATLATAGRPAAVSAASPMPRPRKGGPRPVPQRSDAFAHLSLEALRAYRRDLTAEESRVSYWRRILQARLDVVRAGGLGKELEPALLRPVLTAERVTSGRRSLVDVVPSGDVPPLPRLDELWERRVAPDDLVGQAELDADLAKAETQLSAYRSALHRRIGEATQELIARYREQPALCLSALPL